MPATKKAPAKAKTKTSNVKESKSTAPKAKVAKKVAKKEEAAPIPSAEKQVIIDQYAVKNGDTGSPEVQVALLSSRIEKLILHLKTNASDNHSRRGLLGIVSKRRRLLNYLQGKDSVRYKELVTKLGLKQK